MSKFNEQWIWSESIKFPELIRLGICPLHCKLRSMEFLFSVAVKLRAKNDKRDITDDEKMKRAKQEIQQEFVDLLGIRINYLKQGKGTSNNGNSATRLFENPEISARIFRIRVDIVKGFSKQLGKINSVTTLHDPEEYKESSRKLFEDIVTDFGHVANMPPTVHRFIVHGHIFLQWAKEVNIPLGQFSESALEMRNKDRRKARLCFSRKTSRQDNISDTYHWLLKTSDPLVNETE